MLIVIHILGYRLRNFEIRVGNDEDLVNKFTMEFVINKWSQ